MKKKVCFVPSCNNTSENAPSKIFLSVPVNVERRKKWFSAVKTKQLFHLGHDLFCCEDHFNLEEDASNWMYYKMLGSAIKLKSSVVPHKLIDRYSPKVQSYSVLTDSAKKRKIDYQDKLRKEHETGETVDDGMSLEKPSCSRKLFSEQSPSKSLPSKYSPSKSSPSGNFEMYYMAADPVVTTKSIAVQVNVKKSKYKSVQTNTKPTRLIDTATSPLFKKKENIVQSHTCVQKSPNSSPSTSTKSGNCESEDYEYVGTSSSYESDIQKKSAISDLNESRHKTTICLIEQNSRLYLGIPENAYQIVKYISERQDIEYSDVLISLKKIRLGDTYSRLALDF